MQYNAALPPTGATRDMPKEKLSQELGFEALQEIK